VPSFTTPDRKDSSACAFKSASLSATGGNVSNAALMHSREKAKRWVREQASRFLESYFKVIMILFESL
jgi:predicted trehalose synthase